MIETTILDSIIVGRIDPHIYAFRTNTVPNYLKVGDTYRPISVRLKEWKEIFPDLEHLKEWEWEAKTQDEKYFRDFAVHYYLEKIKQLDRLKENDMPNLSYYSREFFKNAKPEDVDEAIRDIKLKAKHVGSPYQFYSVERLPIEEHYQRTKTYSPRPNQQDTINRFKKARNQGRRNLLMYAVMRFGKSFTSMCCATEMEARTVLIVSAKADVKNEWKETVESHVRFADYTFLDSEALLANHKAVTNLLDDGKKVAIFLTLQDLMGDEVKSKHEDIFLNEIDLLIVDETHFGARAEEYGKVLREAELSKEQIKNEIERSNDTLDDLEKSFEIVKRLKVDTTLHLSGTPYRILMGSEFTPEDIVAFYQFTDIIDDKDKWDKDHLMDEDTKEWDNPYYGFPQMVRFAFNPNESSRRMLEDLRNQGKTASLTELFRPMSISIDLSAAKGHLHFVHEKEVLDLLQIIDGSKEDDNILDFLNYQKLKDGAMCRHIVCVLPFCASCDAFETLLKDNSHLFKNLSQYDIVNISGVAANPFATTKQIKCRISELEAQGKKTITLTVNRMLTGSTVREWDTMLFLKDVSSPQEYDQAIFRLQNQYVKTFEDEKGDTICYNMKPQTLLVDFDPNRMFVMQEQKSKIYNVNTEERGNDELEKRICHELQISPIIVINKGKLAQVVPTDVMDAVRQYSASRTVMDEAREIPTDYALLQDPQIQLLIEGLEPINAPKGINIKPAQGDGDDINPAGDNVDSNGETPSNPSTPDTPKEKDDADKRLATYFAQILFFALLTDDEVNSLNDIISVVSSNENNKRIARNVGLRDTSLTYLYCRLNPFILQDLDYKIKNINELARDASLEPLIRVEHALRKFGRLSISEIVTPSKVADDVVALLPEENIDENTRFLDIASKQAEFACALYRRFGEKIRNNIFSLPTSSLTYEFTRKVYSFLGLPIDNIISKFNSYDLIGENKEFYKDILKNMNFNVIVGNPPYQILDGSGAAGDAAMPIYNRFVEIAKDIKPTYISMIMPSKWMIGGRGLQQFRKDMIEDTHIEKLFDYENDREIFPNTHIDGGLCYILWNNDYSGKVNYAYKPTDGEQLVYQRDLKKEASSPFIVRDFRRQGIIKKVTVKGAFSKIVSSTKPFGIRKDLFNSPERYPNSNLSEDKFENAVKIYGVKGIKGGAKRKIGYITRDTALSNIGWIDKYKLFFTTSYSTGAIDFPEIIVAGQGEICTETFIVIGPFNTEVEQQNCLKYTKTNIFKLLLFFGKGSMQVTQDVFCYVPLQDFTPQSDIDWSKTVPEIDQQLYAKYNLSADEINFIESMIKSL